MSFSLSSRQSDYVLDSFEKDGTKYEITSCYLNDAQRLRIAQIISKMPPVLHVSDGLQSSDELIALAKIIMTFSIIKERKRGNFSSSSAVRSVSVYGEKQETRIEVDYGRVEDFEITVNALKNIAK